MSEIPKLPEPRVAQEIREIFQRHQERTSNILPITSVAESLVQHFDTFIEREIDDIRRQLEILEPWYQVSDEEKELEELERKFEELRVKLRSLLIDVKGGKIKDLKELDLNAIMDAFRMVDEVEKLWNKVQRWSQSLLRQAEMFRQWLQEMLPRQR
jgi:predicted RNase H-like nuclease (RuvC/YqgF family)